MSQKKRLSPPLMFAFRAAHEARDARRAAASPEHDAVATRGRRRPAGRVAVTETLLRHEVGRDLEMLMNSIALESSEDLEPFDHVRDSILNFGIPDIANRTIDELRLSEIAEEVRRALQRYEPRLEPGSIEVQRDEKADKDALKLRFVVAAQLVCHPINVPVEFVADVDFASGDIALSRS